MMMGVPKCQSEVLVLVAGIYYRRIEEHLIGSDTSNVNTHIPVLAVNCL